MKESRDDHMGLGNLESLFTEREFGNRVLDEDSL